MMPPSIIPRLEPSPCGEWFQSPTEAGIWRLILILTKVTILTLVAIPNAAARGCKQRREAYGFQFSDSAEGVTCTRWHSRLWIFSDQRANRTEPRFGRMKLIEPVFA